MLHRRAFLSTGGLHPVVSHGARGFYIHVLFMLQFRRRAVCANAITGGVNPRYTLLTAPLLIHVNYGGKSQSRLRPEAQWTASLARAKQS